MSWADGNRYLEETFSVPVWYVVKRFDFDRVCGLPDLFEDQKSLKNKQKKILTIALWWFFQKLLIAQVLKPKSKPY